MKKYVFESLKFFCAAILCVILSAFATPSWADNSCRNLFDINDLNMGSNPDDNVKYKSYAVPNGTYTMSTPDFPTGSSTANMFFLAGNVSSGASSASNGVFQGTSRTINVSDGYYTIGYRTGITNPNNPKDYSWQIELGSTATAYTPYNPSCGCDGTVVNYVSATGTGVQNGTPTPTNPIEPTFYTQGDMVLRKVGDYADSYDATTGKITRRVGVKVFDGTEGFSLSSINDYGIANYQNTMAGMNPSGGTMISSHFGATGSLIAEARRPGLLKSSGDTYFIRISSETASTVAQFKSWLAAQKAAGTPVTIFYPLENPVEEDWTETSYCETPIKIATTKYNETAFSSLNTALANAISVVDTVVSNTITQAGRIATLQAQKQTRPNDIADDNEKCPAGKKCLLVEDASGVPHWYEIVERYSLLPDGYTELQWIESTGTQYIDTGVTGPARWVGAAQSTSVSDKSQCILGADYVNNSAYSASVYLASQVGSSGVVWRLSSALSTVATTDYAEYDVNFAETSFSGTINGESLSASGVSGFTNWYIGMDRGSSSIYYFIGKIYTQKAYQNNTLIRDFVPAKNPDGKIGMYDLVGGRFYENAGEGSFIAGDPVSE